jgi:hypothetical protein
MAAPRRGLLEGSARHAPKNILEYRFSACLVGTARYVMIGARFVSGYA